MIESSHIPLGYPKKPQNWSEQSHRWNSRINGCKIEARIFAKENASDLSSEQSNHNQTLIIVHGQGEHSGRYSHFTHYLQDNVSLIYSFDLQGHGLSSGARGHIESFDHYIVDLEDAIEQAHKIAPRNSVHLLGHSMGGLIVLAGMISRKNLSSISSTTQEKLNSIIISAPCLGLRHHVPLYKKIPAFILSRWAGKISLSNGIKAEAISRDENVVISYSQDPLVHDQVSARFFCELLSTMSSLQEVEKKLDIPTLFILPLADSIVNSNVAEDFFRQLSCQRKELNQYPNFFHEPFNETEKEKCFEHLKSWISKHK